MIRLNIKIKGLMRAVRQAIKIILEPIQEVPEESLFEIGPKEFYEPLDPSEYLKPEPDVDLEGQMHGNISKPIWLGSYTPMRSPGKVILYAYNLQRFFGGLMNKAFRDGLRLKKIDYEKGADLIAYKTYYHELFHYYADVLKTLFSSRYDSDKEEALAVAYAYRELSSFEKAYKENMAPAIFDYLMDHAFRYTSDGYRDWQLYKSDDKFKSGLLSYISPATTPLLERNGVPVDKLIYSVLKAARHPRAVEETIK
jgi:hypothetical protein